MKIKELLNIVPEHCRIGIVAKIDNGDKIETYQTVFVGHRCKYDEFRHVLRVDDVEIREVHAAVWDKKCGLCIGIDKGVNNEYKEA